MNIISSFLKANLATGMVLITTVLWCQTPEHPGWASQQPLAISQNQCYDKAIEALRSSGLTDLRTQDGWTASGSDYNIRAGISCLAVVNGTMITVSVAATHEYPKANEMRDYLRDYMLKGSMAALTPMNLAGSWKYASSTGKVSVEQYGNQVTLYLTPAGRKAPPPHYIVKATLNGNRLEGNWQFVVDPLVGNDKRFAGSQCKDGRWVATVNQDQNLITVDGSTYDPCNHQWAAARFRRN